MPIDIAKACDKFGVDGVGDEPEGGFSVTGLCVAVIGMLPDPTFVKLVDENVGFVLPDVTMGTEGGPQH